MASYGPFTPGNSVGGRGGQPFQAYRWIKDKSALVVKALNVWWNDYALRGVQVTYSDDSLSPVFGKAEGQQARIVFAPGELVSSLTLSRNGHGTRTGHICITTTAGQTLDVGRSRTNIRPYSMQIGSGLLVGLVGRSGDDIDRLGALFLRTPIVSVAIEHVTPTPKLEGTSFGISRTGIQDESFVNPGEEETKWKFQGSAELPSIMGYRQRTIDTLGPNVKATLSAKIYDVVVSEKVPNWYAGSPTSSPTVIKQKTSSWNASGELQPREAIHCYADSYLGEFSSYKYDSTVTIKLDDGWTSTYPESGVFSMVAFSDVWVSEGNKD